MHRSIPFTLKPAPPYGNHDALFNISIDNTWQAPSHTDEMIAWTRAIWVTLRERTGEEVYINFAGFSENDMLTHAAYGCNYERLRRIKARCDPDNLFRVNQNIAAAANGEART